MLNVFRPPPLLPILCWWKILFSLSERDCPTGGCVMSDVTLKLKIMSLQTKFVVSSNVLELKETLENTVSLLAKLEVEFEKINNFQMSVKVDKVGQSDFLLDPR
jgi:hypothetical protein